MKKSVFLILLLMSMNGFSQQIILSDSININNTDSLNATGFDLTNIKVVADSAYLQEDYTTAISLYESILQQGQAAEIYYNLGNSYYKLGEIAKSILNYERALHLKPSDDDIKSNLEIARAKTIDKIDEIPDIFFIAWIKALINCMHVDAWAKWAIVTFLLFIMAFTCFIFASKAEIKKTGFLLGLLFLVVSVCANIFAHQQKKYLTSQKEAIVMSPSLTVRSTPSENGTSLFIVHEGRKVYIKDNTMKDWKEIRLEDGKIGWVLASAIEII